jgi:eukaryotic-like serine/threonine-protein kinase
VDGRYQIIKRLGTGGFAHTYLAKNLTVPGEPKCVVKQLRPRLDHPRMLQLFKLEAAILGKFKHSQIPQRLECFEHHGDFFLVQDFVAGDDLGKEFTIGHKWREAKVIQFLREMLGILSYVHQKQAIHRDIKPANIIRRWENGELCLIDFGAVQDLNNDSSTPNTVVGTPGYHAPEQADGVANFSSDIYALGMSAIQFLTGQYPVHLPKQEDGTVLWRDLTSISDRLASILERMTRVEAIERYDSAAAVLIDLENLPPESDYFDAPGTTTSQFGRFRARVSATQLLNKTNHQGLMGKTIGIAMLFSLGLVGVNAIVNRSQVSQPTVGRNLILGI